MSAEEMANLQFPRRGMKRFLTTMLCCAAIGNLPLAAQEPSGALPAAPEATHAPPLSPIPGDLSEKSGPRLTLRDAENEAIKNQPRFEAAQFRTLAAGKIVSAHRAGYFPQAVGNATAVEANDDSAVAAGALTTSSISSRAAVGGSLLQLITDFGHTPNLVRAARFEAQAAGQTQEGVRQAVLLDVQSEYFAAQAADSVRRTAEAVLNYRQTALHQLSALAENQLRSTLDVQFAQVLVSEAQLAVVQAQTNVDKAEARLADAMGEEQIVHYRLEDESLPTVPDADPKAYIAQAIAERPDLKALRLHSQSSASQARAERDLNYPTLSAMAAGGEIPVHDATLAHEYGAVGVNLSIPLFNGRLYSSQAAAERLEARAADKDASLRELDIVRDVRVSWAEARDAFLQIAVTERLLDQSNVALRLAQARYDAGLGSIVELNQAELNQTSALIGAATARFDYQRAMAAFHFSLGDLH
jgi:outer membrane protein